MPGRRWSDIEIESLHRQWSEAPSPAPAVIRIRGRSVNGIKRKLVREQMLEAKRPARVPWTREEERELGRLVAKGMGARQVYESGRIARSYDSIAQKISRTGLLSDARRSERMRACRRLRGADLDEFMAAVEEYGESRHTQWFVWKFAVGRGKVKRALRSVGKSLSWKEAMGLPQTKDRFASRVSSASSAAWERRREAMRQSMVDRLREMEAALEKNPALRRRAAYRRRVCAHCKGRWFASEEFFRTTSKPAPDGGRRCYLQRSCRICSAGKRGKKAGGRGGGQADRLHWRTILEDFAQSLSGAHPEFFGRADGAGEVVYWGEFVDVLGGMAAPEIFSLVQSVVAIYSGSAANEVLDQLEAICFTGDPELHIDIWELDEMLRVPVAERPPLVREGKLLAAGNRLAIRLYRVLRLPGYAKSLA